MKILKRIDFYVVIGLIYILFMIWNRLRTRLPRTVPFEIRPEILQLCFKALPIFLIIIVLLRIKNKFLPHHSASVKKIQEWLLKPILYCRDILEKFYARLAKFLYDFHWKEFAVVREQMFYLFNYLIFGKLRVQIEDKYDLEAIESSKRFQIVKRVSKGIVLVPTLLVSSIAVIEIYFIGTIKFFYLLLPILLVPAAWKGFLYTLHEYCFAVIRPGAMPGFDIILHCDKDNKGDIMISKKDYKDIEFVPDLITKEAYSEENIQEIESYYRYCFYVYILSKHYSDTNNEILEKCYYIIWTLRISMLIGFFYPI